MRTQHAPCRSALLRALTASMFTAIAATAGCGTGLSQAPLLVADGAAITPADLDATDVIILDWTGGVSRIYPDQTLAAFDFTAFPTGNGKSLATDKSGFEEAVRAEIVAILSELPDRNIVVLNGEASAGDDVTVVHITQELPVQRPTDIGEGEYDPCNTQSDNAAIIYGQRLCELGSAYPVEEWVYVVANVAAHEIGHTLGFGHVARSEFPPTPGDTFVELMLDGHTFSEMRRAHRFLETQSNCDAENPEHGCRIVVASQAE